MACDRSVIEQAVEAARAEIAENARDLAIPTRELASTLVGVVLREEGGCLFHIGDGIAAVELLGGGDCPFAAGKW
ncbi:protein phosphatase 2C domain-containing protein [Candidatus Accumulibacter phosphatis]|uniref:protein phosphatase 2C domain-containing protein n=1 Tax=Candidatus Accumulibacter phosphatis TaxID=327160 RepID=UPI001B7E079A